jgi:hypothetical protein
MARQQIEQEKMIAEAKAKKARQQKREDARETLRESVNRMNDVAQKAEKGMLKWTDPGSSPLTDIKAAYVTLTSSKGEPFHLELKADGTLTNANTITFKKATGIAHYTTQRERMEFTGKPDVYVNTAQKSNVLDALDKVFKQVVDKGEVDGEIEYEVIITAKAKLK